MDRFSEKQARINGRRTEISAQYPSLWSKMIAEWNQPGSDDRSWLMYSANYLFRTNNIRWAMDPLALGWRIKDAPKVDVTHDLSGLSFVLLTHHHNDHLDIDLLSALRHLPITWVVPDFILTEVVERAGLPRKNIIVPVSLESIELNGIRILPFDGSHWENTPDGELKGVPALGYLIEVQGKRWLFPGDTRAYDASRLPATGPVDELFAHLWLGRGSALMNEPPLLDSFCRFCLDLQPRRIILTHLKEFGRDADDFWDESHVDQVCAKFQEINLDVLVTSAYMGTNILL
jgi:phosphoribosyl 1,2-cyclic phosphodiesterase